VSDQERRIVLAVVANGSYGRNVVQGVREYAERFAPQWRFHYEGSSNHPDVYHRLRLGLKEWHAHGVIGQLLHGKTPELVRLSGVPAVNVSTFRATELPSVSVDDRLVAEEAVHHLADLGARRFAFAGRSECLYATRRLEAFVRTLAAAGQPCLVFQPDSRRPLTWLQEYRQLLAWLRKAPRPLAVLACDNSLGCDILQACQALGVRVPEEVAVLAGDDDDTVCALSVPPLSSVVMPSRMIGYRAAELLDRLMAGAPPPGAPVLVPPCGVEARRSTDVTAVHDPYTAAALRFIRQNANRPISVGDVLAAAPQSRRALERRFIELVGRSPRQEIRRARLERAKALLAGTDVKIEAVAADSGFRRYALFARAFRGATGLTPSAYRAQYRPQGARPDAKTGGAEIARPL
jgi:LacI family transcriptional regulator